MVLRIEDGDWIPLFRKIRKHWIWQDASALRAWVDLIMMANHRDSGFNFRGRVHPISRGQVATTILSMSKRNGWSRNKVRGFLQSLQDDKMATLKWRTFDSELDTWKDSKTDSGFILLTLVNYPVTPSMSEKRTGKRTADGQEMDSGWTADGHIQEREEYKNDKKGEEGAPAAALVVKSEPPPSLASPGEKTVGEDRGIRDSNIALPVSAGLEKPPVEMGTSPAKPELKTKPDRFTLIKLRDEELKITIAAFDFCGIPGPHGKKRAILDLLRQGVAHERIRAAATANPTSDFYVIVKLLRNGKAKPPFVSSPPRVDRPALPPRDEVQRLQDEARAAADKKLMELPADEISAWTREAEQQAESSGVPSFGRKGFIAAALRRRAAQKFGIEGV